MEDYMQIKRELFSRCKTYVNDRINTIQETLSSLAESKNEETKSSAGDKYETGRAMIQIEENKNKAQLAQALELKHLVSTLNTDKISEKGEVGSLVVTEKVAYYLSIGLGKVVIGNKIYFCVSPSSPIGLQLINKVQGDSIILNKNKMIIKAIY